MAIEARTGRKATIASRLAETLREEVLAGRLEPGAKINLDRLREAMGVSASPLREAMGRLVAEGLVESEDQRGYRVVSASLSQLREVIELRIEVTMLALRHCVNEGTLDWESDLMGALYRLTRSEIDPARPDSLAAWEIAHRNFHHALIADCRRPMLLALCTRLQMLHDRYRRMAPPVAGDPTLAADHRAIAEAAVARDADTAVALLRDHFAHNGARLTDYLAERLPETAVAFPETRHS